MKKHIWGIFGGFILFSMLIFSFACNKSIEIGAELLEQDQANIIFTDTISIRSSTVAEDSVLTFSYRSPTYLRMGTQLCGDVDDPIFGNTQAAIYTQFCLPTTGAPSFKDVTIDSLVLHLAYDSLGIYGDLNQSHSIEVFRMKEVMDTLQPYYSNRKFATEALPVGGIYNFVPNFKKDSAIVLSNGVESYKTGARLNIKLDKSLATTLGGLDSTTFASDAAFVQAFKGLYIRSSKKNNTMLSFNFNSDLTDMVLYFRTSSNVNGRFYLKTRASCPSTSYFKHNLNTKIQEAVKNPKSGENMLWLQGMSGTNVKMELPYIQNLPKNIIINKAELEMTVATTEGDNAVIYPPPTQLIIDPSNNATEEYISDVTYAINRQLLSTIFGGAPVTTDGKTTYKFNISDYVHLLLHQPEKYSSTFYIHPYIKPQKASRIAFFGSKHSQYPIKLRLTYTRL